MKNKLVGVFILLIISVGLIFYFGENQKQKEDPLFSFLNQQYSNRYQVESYIIGNSLVINASSNTYCCGENSIDPFDEKATPSVIIQDLKGQKIKSIYEISIKNNGTDGKFDKGNIILGGKTKWIKEYFVAEWSIFYGGSSGLKGMAIFGNKDGQFQPITGYPLPDDPKSSINLTDKLSSRKYTFPLAGDSDFSEVTDLNNDGKPDLLFANWHWDLANGESHYQARPWNLQVFELVDNKFTVAKWWNKGEIYRTPESIGYDQSDTTKLRQIFYEKYK